eukprot:TRINITY_DN9758_c0_g1_i2.p1 TRINITY_DN9758_c0_g1~~TRINITY_DN9758_c0_g1_i2.p1  ORF type:complete len:305 (+),score=46.76 TRINITY_DN9758_c0_g1_i2:156-1070(+)
METQLKQFATAGASAACASLVTNPMDVIKVRLQLQGELQRRVADPKYNGTMRGIWRIVTQEGVLGLWKGYGPALLRASSYSSLRLGLYEPVKSVVYRGPKEHTPMWAKFTAAAFTGSLAALVSNPLEIAKVKLQSSEAPVGVSASSGEAVLAPRRSTYGVLSEVVRTRGVSGLWVGATLSIQRAAVLGVTQLAGYDVVKNLMRKGGFGWAQNDTVQLQFIASMITGLITVTVTSPIDVMKTRVQSHDSARYSGISDIFVQTVRTEGVRGLFKGWFPNYIRLGPHTVLLFLIYERLRAAAGLSAL